MELDKKPSRELGGNFGKELAIEHKQSLDRSSLWRMYRA